MVTVMIFDLSSWFTS